MLNFISKLAVTNNQFLKDAEAYYFFFNCFCSKLHKTHTLPILLPTYFIKVLPLPQKINRFRFHIFGLKYDIKIRPFLYGIFQAEQNFQTRQRERVWNAILVAHPGFLKRMSIQPIPVVYISSN